MKKTLHSPIAILGAGSWGTALALYLSRRGQQVRLWTHDPDAALLMQQTRINKAYLPDYPFPDTLQPVATLQDALAGNVEDVMIAVPSSAFRDVLTQLQSLLLPSTRVLWATKGLDPTGQLLHEVAANLLGTKRAYAVISGPSFAKEVAAGMPTAVVIASPDPLFTHALVERFNSTLFRIYSSTDMVGVEMGGIMKNVLAIATGISDGMKFGANARSALITRGLAEMIRLGKALGGREETFVGLSGVGDLVLTCTDNQSRNRRFGLALGEGQSLSAAAHAIGQVVEGKHNAELVMQLANKHHVEVPIIAAVWGILSEQLTPLQAMQQLLSREPTIE